MPASPAAPPPRPVSRKTHLILAACACVGVTALAACGSSAASPRPGPGKPDLTVAVVAATGAAAVYIAAQDGYFASAGLHVTIKPVISSTNALAGLVNGSIDIDEGQWTTAFDAEVHGRLKLHALAPGNAGGVGLEQLIIPKHSPITTVRQLAGKTIAVNALAGLPELLTDTVLAENGVDPSQVHFTAVAFPAMGTALAADRVDAAFMVEPYITQTEAATGAQSLFDLDQGATANFPVTGYMVTQAWMARYPRTAAAFAAALHRGQVMAATSRAAVEKALTHYTTISPATAAVMALGSYPTDVTSADLQRVGDLMQQEHALKVPTTKVAQLAQELTR